MPSSCNISDQQALKEQSLAQVAPGNIRSLRSFTSRAPECVPMFLDRLSEDDLLRTSHYVYVHVEMCYEYMYIASWVLQPLFRFEISEVFHRGYFSAH